MASFEYLALTAQGRKDKGFIEADSERHARQRLREQGLRPVELSQAKQKSSRFSLQRSVPGGELSLFTRHLAALVQSAVPLEEALSACARQCNHHRLRAIILQLRSQVLEGQSLSAALRNQGQTFPEIYPALVAAGEQSGELAQVLIQLADYNEKRQKLKSRVLQSAIYPLVLALVASGVVALLMVYVVPKVVAQFEHSQQTLPWLTQLMIAISDGLQQYGLNGLIAVLVSLVLLQRLFRQPDRQRWLHRQLLRLPVMGRVLIRLETARLFGTLSIMSHSGVPLLEALQTARATLANRYIRQQVEQATSQVREGGSLSGALEQLQLFPPVAIYMLANGEHSGELGAALNRAASQQEDELDGQISIATSLLEPLMIVLFGAVVLAIVLAIMLPILQLNNISGF
ncbi:MAG: type II secretion system inner membrane protein GspF [Marinobacterium sp.]|nr:type II secretion system inner membrane protein GspF [Marinobacterium sp.]